MVRLILLRGYPASGKSTIGQLLERAGVGQFIDHDYLLGVIRALADADESNSYQELHQLELTIARARLQEGKTVIIARECSSVASIRPYALAAEESGAALTVFHLKVEPKILRKRIGWPLKWRTRKDEGLSAELLERWIVEHPFESWYGEHIMDADQPVKTVAHSIAKKLR